MRHRAQVTWLLGLVVVFVCSAVLQAAGTPVLTALLIGAAVGFAALVVSDQVLKRRTEMALRSAKARHKTGT